MQAKGNGPLVYDTVTELFKQKTADEWKPILTQADVPFSKCQNREEILEDEQAWANECFYKMTFPNGNERVVVRQPVKFQEAGVPEYNRAPMIGEQGAEVLKEIGYTDEQVKAMLDSGALYVWSDEKK